MNDDEPARVFYLSPTQGLYEELELMTGVFYCPLLRGPLDERQRTRDLPADAVRLVPVRAAGMDAFAIVAEAVSFANEQSGSRLSPSSTQVALIAERLVQLGAFS